MSGLVDSAAAIFSASEKRLEISAQNVANISTSGYKRKIAFQVLLESDALIAASPEMLEHSDPAQGKLTPTGNPLDLAIGGAGFFELRDGDGFVYSRQGQFHIDADGRVVTAQGLALQDAEGGDLVLDHARVTIAEDGTVLDGERPIARIAVKLPAGGDAASAIGDRRLAAGRSRWADG